MTKKKDILLMFSGGKDSVACIPKLTLLGYRVRLVNFDTGSITYTGYETKLALELESIFGCENVVWEGVISTVPFYREHLRISAESTFKEFLEKYGDFSPQQLQCLNCRSAMYKAAIIYAIQNGIECIAEGARKEQQFAIEQAPMKAKYEKLCHEFGIELLWPVYEASDEDIYHLHNKILIVSSLNRQQIFCNEYGYIRGESKCLQGMPAFSNSDCTTEELNKLIMQQAETAAKYFDAKLQPHFTRSLIPESKISIKAFRNGGPYPFNNIN